MHFTTFSLLHACMKLLPVTYYYRNKAEEKKQLWHKHTMPLQRHWLMYTYIYPTKFYFRHINMSTLAKHFWATCIYTMSTVSVLPLHHVICGLHVWVWNNIPCVCGIESEDIKQNPLATVPFYQNHTFPHFTSKTIPYFSTCSLHTRG